MANGDDGVKGWGLGEKCVMRCTKDGSAGVKEWGAGEMWVCPKVLRMGDGVRRMGTKCG